LIGRTRVETTDQTTFHHGDELVETISHDDGGETLVIGIPFSRAVSVMGEMRDGTLRCTLVTVEPTKAQVIDRQSAGAGPSKAAGFLCTLLGLLGIGFSLVLIRRKA
jgi:hypothetical protein